MINKKARYYLFTACANIVLIFSSGAIIQSFLSSVGLSAKQIGVYTLCISVVQILTLLLSTFLTDRFKNIPRTIGLFTLPALLFFAVMIFLCVCPVGNPKRVFFLAVFACFFWNFFYGLRIVMEYKLPYYIADISEYPRLSNISGIILSVLGVVVSGLFIFLSKRFSYRGVIGVCFVLSLFFALLAAASVLSLKNEKPTACPRAQNSKIGLALFSLPQTKYLAVPAVIRGIGNGIMGMAAVVMLSCVTDDPVISSLLATVTAAATVFSCFLYSKIYRKIKTVRLMLIGGIIQAVALLFLLSGSTAVFLVFYFIAFAGEAIVDYGTPVYVTEIVPYEQIGGYTAIRMLLFTGGVAIGNYLAGMLSSAKPHLLMGICIAAQLIHVVWYFCFDKLFKQKKPA